MHTEPKPDSRMDAEQANEREPKWRIVYDETRDAPSINKGQSAEKLPRTTLCLDTGTPIPPPETMRHPENQEEIDAVYRETISRGTVDHHTIDATVDMPANKRRCTTKMLADFPDDALAMMRERGTTSVTSHHESDLDSICATYLAKSLLERKRLPQMAAKLSDFVNRVDYGMLEQNDPDKFLHSLQGTLSSLRQALFKRRETEISAVWQDDKAPREEKISLSNVIRNKYQNLLLKHMFEVLNAAERMNTEGIGVDFDDFDIKDLGLDRETADLIDEGSQSEREKFEKFDTLFKNSEKTDINVTDKKGQRRKVMLLVMDMSAENDISPLDVTSIAYNRVPPDTIIAVYAGPERKKGGDRYDIGMKPESTEIFDLKFLEKTLNEAEAERRKPVIAELEKKVADGTATTEEQAKLAKWKTLRPGFEHTGHGDPTVSVAGNSLVAASTTSLLEFKDFRAALEKARQENNQTQG